MKVVRRIATLTQTIIGTARPENRRYTIWDARKKGFGVRVETSGVKSYLIRFRVGEGGRKAIKREIVLGRYGNLTPEQARKQAGKILNLVDQGFDPALDRREKRHGKTIAELCDLYLEEGTATKKASTLLTDRGRIERHIKPLLGRKAVAEVTEADIERFIREVTEGKTRADLKTKKRGRAIVRGGKGTASRTVGLLGGIFTFAVRRKMRADNPVHGAKRHADRKCERFLSARELASLGEALRDSEVRGVNLKALSITRLLTFTGARKGEIEGLRWTQIDFAHSCLRLGDSKTGAKIIHLGPPALAILSNIPKSEKSPFVFPAESGTGHYQGMQKFWEKVRLRAGLQGVRLHDLRHSFASIGLITGDTLFVISKLLGHADPKTTARYAHIADNPLRDAAQRISDQIAAAMNGVIPE